MEDIVNGYVVVLCPENVGQCHGDKLTPVSSGHQTVDYRGPDRDPWWNLDESFYAGPLDKELVQLRRTIQSTGTSLYSPGVCLALSDAKAAIAASRQCRPEDELIWIDNSRASVMSAPGFLGRDSYIDGFGSWLRLGIFSDAAVFADFIPREGVNNFV